MNTYQGMKLDDYSFELHQKRVDKCHTQCQFHPPPPFTYPHILTLLTSNSLLYSSVMIALLASVIQLSLTYPNVPDEAQMNNHQVSCLLSIRLFFIFISHLVKLGGSPEKLEKHCKSFKTTLMEPMSSEKNVVSSAYVVYKY